MSTIKTAITTLIQYTLLRKIPALLLLVGWLTCAQWQPVYAGWGEPNVIDLNNQATSLAQGDLNGDGALDLVTSYGDQANRIYLNDGTGRFPTATPLTGLPNASIIALGDLDGNGTLDLVSGAAGQPLTVAFNDGAAHFNNSISLVMLYTATASIAIGDTNSDGVLDIVVGNQGQPGIIYTNNGTGHAYVSTPLGDAGADTTNVVLGDVNDDGVTDMIIKGRNDISKNEFSQPLTGYISRKVFDSVIRHKVSIANSEGTDQLTLGDINADGVLDIVTIQYPPTEDTPILHPQVVNYKYSNGGGNFAIDSSIAISAFVIGVVKSIAVGDVSSDGMLDIIIRSQRFWDTARFEHVSVYLKESDGVNAGTYTRNTDLSVPLAPESSLGEKYPIALGDINGDEELDIVDGFITIQNSGNQGFYASILPSSAFHDFDDFVLGDIDGNRTLDFISIEQNNNDPHHIAIQTNDGIGNFANPQTIIHPPFVPTSKSKLALGDLDADGQLDIIVCESSTAPNSSSIYRNVGGLQFDQRIPLASGSPFPCIGSPVVGDLNGDGYLDIVSTTPNHPGVIYYNRADNPGHYDQGTPLVGFERSTQISPTLALGDLNNDGVLDIVAAGDTVHLYLNDGQGRFSLGLSVTDHAVTKVLLGDLNGDNSLDLVTYAGVVNIYFNNHQGGFAAPVELAASVNIPPQFLSDINGDGLLDIVSNVVYLNKGQGRFFKIDAENETDVIVALGDINGDGSVDRIKGAALSFFVYININGRKQLNRSLLNQTVLVAAQRPGQSAIADGYSSAEWLVGPIIPITYTLFDQESAPVAQVEVFYSLNGGGNWQRAVATNDTQSTVLATSPYPQGTQHIFRWDTAASGFFGQSDNVVLRVVAYTQAKTPAQPGVYRYENGVAGSFQWAADATMTLPFRVRSTTIQVTEAGKPVSGAIVYRLPKGQSSDAQTIGGLRGPFITDRSGNLRGFGQWAPGDGLVALLPITATTAYTLYHTSAPPTLTGLDVFTVITTTAKQTLAVSPDNPLLLFNLDMALEWDASGDTDYQFRLESDIKRASELLFDFTNGHAALGRMRVFHDAKRYLSFNAQQPWLDADIRVYASNQLHPNATQGGVVANGYLTESLLVAGATSVMTYTAGQVNIGAVWNADGEASNNTGEDWARALAHELGHYLFYLDDHYLGEDEHGYLVPLDTCQYTAMTDPFREDYTEFLFQPHFQENCKNTLAAKTTGRSDWATIQRFYPALQATTANAGPSSLPLAVTQVEFLSLANVLTTTLPTTPTQLLSLPNFYLIDQENRSVRPGAAAQAFLYQENQIIELGSPLLDRVTARGVRNGDEICLYDPLSTRLGCVHATTGNEPLKLVTRPEWQPQLEISPVTSRTIDIRLPLTNTGLSGFEPVQAQLFGENITQTLVVDLLWDANTQLYLGQFRAELPVLAGYVRLWVNESHNAESPRREVVADYQLGGSPVPQGQRGVPQGQRGVPQGQRGVPRLQRGVPASSANGQVIIYGEGLNFPDGEFFTLQTIPTAPELPSWATLVGQVYRLSTSAGAPRLDNKTSITFQYLGRDVPPGEENFLRIYQYNQGTWRPLATTLNTTYNVASAAINAPGIYALMSSFEIPLVGPQSGSGGGWNNVAYMAQTARAVTEALQSIEGAYSIIWGYEPHPTDGRFWQAFDPAIDPTDKFYDLVNNLKQLQFGRGYWIHATQDITLFLKGDATVSSANLDAATTPPALYYGDLLPAADFAPAVGMPVTAWVGTVLCGQGEISLLAGQLVYVVAVAANGSGAEAGCGANGQLVTFQVNGVPMLLTSFWDNQTAHYLPLTNSLPEQLYLPVIFN